MSLEDVEYSEKILKIKPIIKKKKRKIKHRSPSEDNKRFNVGHRAC